jgi:hypothetical protein
MTTLISDEKKLYKKLGRHKEKDLKTKQITGPEYESGIRVNL